MKRQGLKIFGFLFLTQLFFGIASYFILMFSAGSKILAAYMCSAVCCIYGVVVLIWHKKRHTDTRFWKAVLIAGVLCFLIAPFPNLYSVRGMTSATAIVKFK